MSVCSFAPCFKPPILRFHTSQSILFPTTIPMTTTPWQGSAPLLRHKDLQPTTLSQYSTIHDVPTTVLSQQRELALTLLLDRSNQKILFQIPNTQLNWRFHFGCPIHDISALEQEVKTTLLDHSIQVEAIRKAGTMLFTFPDNDPLRVHVLEAAVSSTSACAGVWTEWTAVPYQEMWADDILWLPWFLTNTASSVDSSDDLSQVSFEGHFIFDGNPGPTSQLIAHNCQQSNNQREA